MNVVNQRISDFIISLFAFSGSFAAKSFRVMERTVLVGLLAMYR